MSFSLVKPETLEELVDLITKEPTDDVDEKLKYKYVISDCSIHKQLIFHSLKIFISIFISYLWLTFVLT